MTFFESLLALLLAAILLLQVSRRVSLPYPTMLAAAGVAVAAIPGAPTIRLDPGTALALFIAPALLDAAFDFPAGAAAKLWRPLVALAVFAVLLTTAAVAWLGVVWVGLPVAAAVALGAIVAPPDAAAATAVLSGLRLPRRTVAVLQGESLFNDATALLIFGAATTLQARHGIDGGIALRLGLAAPGGALLGIGAAAIYRRVTGSLDGTLGGNLLQFVNTFLLWIIAERLHLSAVLCVVGFAMTIARDAGRTQNPRGRVHSYAVWDTVVFLLNVLAFLLMGMQARTIIGSMATARLEEAAVFAAVVVAVVIVVRMVTVIAFNRAAKWLPALRSDDRPAGLRDGVLIGWTGMRGLVTLATSFALPANFPGRDLIVLTAFAVVLATLVLQGATLKLAIRLLGLDDGDVQDRELKAARARLAQAALDRLAQESDDDAARWRHGYEAVREAVADPPNKTSLRRHRELGLATIACEREALDDMRATGELGGEGYLTLQEQLDFKELSILSDDDRRIEPS